MGFVYDSTEAFVFINSYSVLTIICVIAVGLLYVLLKSYLFHDSHIHPTLTAKLFSMRLSSVIQASFDVYSQGVIWLSYSYLVMMAAGVMTYFDLIYSWVFYTSFTLTILSSYLLIIDVEKEMATNKEEASTTTEDIVLTWEEEELE